MTSCSTCLMECKTKQGLVNHLKHAHVLDHKVCKKEVRKITFFFTRITQKPKPIAIELKEIRKSPSDSMDEEDALEEVQEEPKKQESKKPKVSSSKPVIKTLVTSKLPS